MSPVILFVITLIAGISCVKISSKGKGKGIIRLIGIILCAFSVFGLFTEFL